MRVSIDKGWHRDMSPFICIFVVYSIVHLKVMYYDRSNIFVGMYCVWCVVC